MARIPAFPGGWAHRALITAGLVVVSPFAVLAACATGEELNEGTTETGGARSAGGAGSGGDDQGTGATASGGTSTSGGASGAGGAGDTGGGAATGAVTGSGGAAATGGGAASGGSVGSGGAASTGGTAATGGAATGGATGGAASTGGAKATGGAASTGGAKATGGAASTGGAKATGGTAGCADADADGITDCTETDDGSAWTDPAIFNGLHVQLGNQCSGQGNCSENDTLQEVNACMQGNIDEEKNQRAGWDWNDSPDNVCDTDYGFEPNWTRCDTSWAARWNGCIHFETAGPHCFQITGGTDEACAALYFNGNSGSADVQTGTAVKCFSVGAGNYPLLFHYTMDGGSSSGLHVRYCDAAGGTTCTPSAAIPAQMLRTTCP